jgi:hypothetical protein
VEETGIALSDENVVDAGVETEEEEKRVGHDSLERVERFGEFQETS